MSKVVKTLGIVVGIVVLVIVLAIISLMTFISPNRLKPMLTQQVMKYTGRQLTLNGDLSWTFFPSVGVKVGHMTLSNPNDFPEKTFAEISDATISVKLMPLLSGKIESSGIVLNGLKIHLIKNAQGHVNWSFNIPTAATTTNDTSAKSPAKKPLKDLNISAVDVSNASITYVDEGAKKSYDIKQFEFHATNINLLQPFPIKSTFDFSAQNPAAEGHVSLTGNIALNLTTDVYSIRNLLFTADIQQQNKKISLNVMGDVVADLNRQTIEWTGFKGKVANVMMQGKINVTNLSTHPVATGTMQLQPFDLKETLKSIGQNVDALQTAKTVTGNLNFTASENAVTAQSNMNIDTLQIAKLTLSKLSVKANLQNGVLNFAPISAQLYQGSLNGQASVNLNTPAPQMKLQAQLSNIQAEPMLQDLRGPNQKMTIAGLGNLELQLTTAGQDAASIKNNLNGTSRFSFNNGNIVGVDLGYLVDSAYSLAKRQAPVGSGTGKTSFGTLTGTAIIRNGVIQNNDLFSDAPRFETRGAGTIDLVQQKIDYRLQTTVKQRTGEQKNDLTNLYGISIPVLISGNLNNPSVRLDSGELVKAIAKQQTERVTQQAKDKIEEQLPDKAKELLKGKAGDVLNNLLGH